MTNPSVAFRPVDNLAMDDIVRLERHLDDFNTATTQLFDVRLLSIVLKLPNGEIYAGLHGHTWGQCCEIKILWIADSHRRQGLGRKLLRAAENEARERGCRQVVLSTHSFQAPDFYEKEGYERVASVMEQPRGHAHILMLKRLYA